MKKAKIDRNQPLAVAGLRALNFLVQPIHECGGGVPDLIVSGDHPGGMWRLLLVELKCNDWIIPSNDPRWQDTLTPDELDWHRRWRYAPVMTTNRLRWILSWFGWPDDYIRAELDTLPDAPGVKAALRKIERKCGLVEDDVMATILYE